MLNINHVDLLVLVETYIEDNSRLYPGHWISSEESLSESFDDYLDEIKPDFICTCSNGCNDDVALNELFSNYADSLCSEGRLHSEQVQYYCYVGKYS